MNDHVIQYKYWEHSWLLELRGCFAVSAPPNVTLRLWDLREVLSCVFLLSSAPRIRWVGFSFSFPLGQITLLASLPQERRDGGGCPPAVPSSI